MVLHKMEIVFGYKLNVLINYAKIYIIHYKYILILFVLIYIQFAQLISIIMVVKIFKSYANHIKLKNNVNLPLNLINVYGIILNVEMQIVKMLQILQIIIHILNVNLIWILVL